MVLPRTLVLEAGRPLLSVASMFHPVKIDLVDELRLRRWARMNFVPADERSSNWHPIILDEMQAQDAESKMPQMSGPKWLTQLPHIVGPSTAIASAEGELYYN